MSISQFKLIIRIILIKDERAEETLMPLGLAGILRSLII
jgi:hypothetical protein